MPNEVTDASSPRPLVCRGLLFFAILACLLAAELSRAAEGQADLVPVWAFVNGTAPVADAQVGMRIDGGLLSQADGTRWKRTNQDGVALLEVDRLPRRFTVVVRGGRAHGMRVPGTLRRTITRGRGGSGSVEINPLTTLLARLEGGRADLGESHLRRAVKSYFGVPRWADLGESLRLLGDEWFDSGAYLRAARRAGSIERLDRDLARDILAGEQRRIAPATRRPRATASIDEDDGGGLLVVGGEEGGGVGSWLDLSPRQLASKVFKGLAGFVGQTTAGVAINSLLRLAGIGSVNKGDIDRVREQLDALGRQIAELSGKVENVQRSVERGRASALLHQSDEVLAAIDHARTQLTYLANLDQNKEPDLRAKFARTIDDYIGAKLLDAPAVLAKHLSPSLGIGDNVIKATSRALAADRIFARPDSVEVETVYDYFVTYQTQLGVLLANYWDAHQDTYPPAAQEGELAQLQSEVQKQKGSLKPPIPRYTFFDTRTPAFMWGTESENVSAYKAWLQHDRRDLRLNGFGNWQLPSSHDFHRLIGGAVGSPQEWLRRETDLGPVYQLYWTSEVAQRTIPPIAGWGVTIFDLRTDQLEQHGYEDKEWLCLCGERYCPNPGIPFVREFFQTKHGHLMLLRYTAPGESYWW